MPPAVAVSALPSAPASAALPARAASPSRGLAGDAIPVSDPSTAGTTSTAGKKRGYYYPVGNSSGQLNSEPLDSELAALKHPIPEIRRAGSLGF